MKRYGFDAKGGCEGQKRGKQDEEEDNPRAEEKGQNKKKEGTRSHDNACLYGACVGR